MNIPRTKRLAIALISSLVTVGMAQESEAWTGLEGPPFPHWGQVPVSYYTNRGSYPPNIADVAEKRIQMGFASWAAPNCTFFETLLAGDEPSGTYDLNDGKNIILWINNPNTWPSELGPVDSVIGVTLPVWSNDGMGDLLIDDADIIFNNIGFCWYDFDPKSPDTTCSGGKPVDILSILTHEQGHFLGLGHSNVSGATMEPAYLGGNSLATLEQDDIDGVCALYPIGGSSSAGGATCDVCRGNAAKKECVNAAKSCTSTCLGLGDCLLQCPKNDVDAYDACATKCTAQFKDGLTAYINYTECICNICNKPCASQCAGPSDTSSGAGPCANNSSAAGVDNGDGDVCVNPDFIGSGGCGCALGRRDEGTGVVVALGLLFVARSRRRRRVITG